MRPSASPAFSFRDRALRMVPACFILDERSLNEIYYSVPCLLRCLAGRSRLYRGHGSGAVSRGCRCGFRGLPVAAMKANLEGIIAQTRRKYPQAKIVLAGMKMPPSMGAYAEPFNKIFGEVAKESHAALVPFLLEGVGGNRELNLPDFI